MNAPSNNSAMPGNFDFPPASRSSTAASRSTRQLLHQRIRDSNSARAQQQSLISSNGPREPRRASFQDPTTAPPPSTGRHARPFNRRARGGPLSESRTPLLMERLRSTSSEADSLLDHPVPRIGSPDISTREYSGEAEVNSRHRKRRKIDHDAGERGTGVGMNGFRYGYRGSVAPGPLRMELALCDGGQLHTETTRTGRDYLAQNVLRNDRSVYCTTTNKCNIILRHKDETTFTLNKIVIKAPATGFTAPIQEGLIFIAMTSVGLIPHTDPYKIRTPSPPSGNSTSRDEENQRPPSRRRDSISRSVPPPISHVAPLPSMASMGPEYNLITAGFFPGMNDQHYPFSSPTSNTVTATRTMTPPPLIPGFEITSHCDSPSSDEEEPSSAATLADRHRRDQAPPPYVDHSTDSEDVEEGIERALEARALGISSRMLRGDMRGGNSGGGNGGRGGGGISGGRGRRRTEPSRIECRVLSTEVKAGSQQQPTESGTTDGEGNSEERNQQQQQQEQEQTQQLSKPPYILPPHAHFFIGREKSVVSVKFEPAVTGKFILLKLWSPNRDQNIDIQSIIAYGFAGPRYFSEGVVL